MSSGRPDRYLHTGGARLISTMSAEVKLITISDQVAGARIDSFLTSHINQLSRVRIQRAIEDGDILVNDRTVKPSYRLRAGDLIEIELGELHKYYALPSVELRPEPIPLNIVFEDDDLVVVDKPAGMIVHPGAGVQSGTLANALVYHFAQLSGAAGRIRPGIVHRLDKETSGLLVVAKNDLAHERLSDQFRQRQVLKLYLALVYGQVSEPRGEIDARIGRSPHNRTRMAVLRGGAGRPALTLFETVKRYQEFSLLKVQIKTGRTHQIRVHLAHIGHPVVGDATYGSGRENFIRNYTTKRQIIALGRNLLHSTRLAFYHPRTGEKMDFSSPLPAEFASLLARLD
jgi:23S rRNA pseudouridine1911/1915/1917 synthase